ncbi:MAG: CRISPR-associated endonuclease Cas2 [Clostridiaceae bacterium]|nr:CRISPR-associated endonuclease Cas2 [Clostridiaceae bacterium]
MMILITYDVNTQDDAGKTRLRKVAKKCVNYGQRVQNSVFECVIDSTTFVRVRHELEEIIDPEKDSLRYYHLGKNWRRKVTHIGAKETYDPEGTLLI